MIIWVDDGLFKTGAAHDMDRLALLRGAHLRRHALFVSNDTDRLVVEADPPEHFKRWCDGLDSRLREETELAMEALSLVSANMVTRGGGVLFVVCPDTQPIPAGCCALDLQSAVRIIDLLLAVLVENIINDAAFLKRVMPPVWRRTLRQWERDGELSFEHAGGISTMRQIVERFAYSVDKDAEGTNDPGPTASLPPDAWRLVHFALFDHDGDTPSQPSSDAQRMSETCSCHGMERRCHRLRRRDQEAYLPLPALREIVETEITDDRDREQLLADLDSHFALPTPQRHFTPLPKLGEEPFFKNEFFREEIHWRDGWFEDLAEEMTDLAEKIAAAK